MEHYRMSIGYCALCTMHPAYTALTLVIVNPNKFEQKAIKRCVRFQLSDMSAFVGEYSICSNPCLLIHGNGNYFRTAQYERETAVVLMSNKCFTISSA